VKSGKIRNTGEHWIMELLRTSNRKGRSWRTRPSLTSPLRDYVIAAISVGVVCAACFPLSGFIGYQAVGLIFLMVIAVLSLLLGRGAIFFAALLSSAVWNFFFIPPLLTFHIHRVHDIISLVANLMVALVGATLITRIRKSRIDLEQSRERIAMVNTFLESLNTASSIKDVVKVTQQSFREFFEADVVIYLKEKKGKALSPRAFGDPVPFGADPFRIALGVFLNPETEVGNFYPMKEPRGIFGVMGTAFLNNTEPEPETRSLIGAFCAQAASALEREISIDLAKERDRVVESEKLFQTILNSLSHELRTPVAIMSSAISNLNDPRTSAKPDTRKQIIAELEDALRRMNYLIANILDMSRIESGHLKLNLQVCDLADLAGHVVHTMRSEPLNHHMEIRSAEGLPMVRGDISLLGQALTNILHNAVEYTPDGTPVIIDIRKDENAHVELSVSDHGPGVPASQIAHIFDKFFRVPGSRSGGTGLGLTISKAIIEAHRGQILAGNREGGGLKIVITLPAETSHGSE
jgi:two-component system, OmpR family, sensor histidine kinase KdpD